MLVQNQLSGVIVEPPKKVHGLLLFQGLCDGLLFDVSFVSRLRFQTQELGFFLR